MNWEMPLLLSFIMILWGVSGAPDINYNFVTDENGFRHYVLIPEYGHLEDPFNKLTNVQFLRYENVWDELNMNTNEGYDDDQSTITGLMEQAENALITFSPLSELTLIQSANAQQSLEAKKESPDITPLITIQNPQSYPIVGGNWVVKFKTVGTTDLTITGINGTTFGESLPADLKFFTLENGTHTLTPTLGENSVIFQDYTSNGEGSFTSHVFTSGKHNLEFQFGDDVEFAHNDASDAWCDISSTACNTDWKKRKEIVIDNTKVSGSTDLANFPILVNFTGTNFTDVKDETQSAGQDIRFTDKQGNLLQYEIEDYDEPNTTMAIWVKSNSTGIETDFDTTIYMYYGNSGASDISNATDVWNSNYEGVWHIHDDFLDSTSNDNDGTNNGSTDSSAKIADG